MTSECPKCKSPVAREGQRFCYRCGHELPAAESLESPPVIRATVISEPAKPTESSGGDLNAGASDASPADALTDDSPTKPQPGGATEVLKAETTEVMVDTSPNDAVAGPDAVLRILLPTGDLFDRDLFHVDIQLGKGPRNDIVIADPAVSSAHAIISYADDNYSIRDLGSRNGTYVDGERLTEPRVLQHGDVIGLGLSKLTFRLTAHDRTASVLEATAAVQAPPPLTEESLGHAVVSAGLAKQEDVDRVRSEAKNRRLARALIDGGLVTDIALRDLMSSTFQIPSIDLDAAKPDEAVAARLTAQLARDHQMLAVGEESGNVILAVADPTNTTAIEEARSLLGGKVSIRVATASQVAAFVERQYAPKLVGVLPSGDSLEYPITQYETSIGKAGHNDIVLADPTVSNAHAILIAREGMYSVADMGSRNGTFINGERLAAHAHTLRHGDTVQLGQTVLTFRNPNETAGNVTAVLSPEALDEVRKRAASAGGERPADDKPAGAPSSPAALAAAAAGGAAAAGSETGSGGEHESEADKKKKKKKKGKDERMRAAYISGASRILAQVIAVLMSVGLALYLTRQGSDSSKPVLETSGKGKTKLKIASPGAGIAFEGGVFEASGVVQVPGTDGVYFVDDGRPAQILWMMLDQTAHQSGPIKPVDLGVSVADPESIAYGGSFFYVMGSQSDSRAGERNALVRFALDPSTHSLVGQAEVMTDLRSFLFANVPELKGLEAKGEDGGVNVEGIAYDPTSDRLMLGLRSPVVGGKALIVPLKLRDPRGQFSTANLLPPGSAIQLPLGGLGIRDIEFDLRSSAYYIIAGAAAHGESPSFSLWEWNGGTDMANPESTPREITKLDGKMKPEGITHIKIGGKDFIFIVGDGSSYLKLEYLEAP